MIDFTAPRPWTVETNPSHRHWTNSISIFDRDGGEVAVLTRGYEGDKNGDGCPSFQNANLIVSAVNAIKEPTNG